MFQSPFFLQSAAAVIPPAIVAPVLSNLTVWLKADTLVWGGTTIPSQAYTSASGNVGFFGVTRSIAATTREMSTDWNADAMSQLATAKQDGSMNLRCEAGIKIAGTVGAGTAHAMSPPPDDRFRFLLAWLFDLDQVRGGIGAANAAVIAVNQLFVEVSLPVSQVGSLLIAAGWNQQEDARPFVWSPGWAKLDEQALGAGDQPAGSIATKISTAAGSETVRMTGDVAVGQWAIAAVEFLRG